MALEDKPLQTAGFEDLSAETKADLLAVFKVAEEKMLSIFVREARKGKRVEEIIKTIEDEI